MRSVRVWSSLFCCSHLLLCVLLCNGPLGKCAAGNNNEHSFTEYPLNYKLIGLESAFLVKDLRGHDTAFNFSQKSLTQPFLLLGTTNANCGIGVSHGPLSSWQSLHEDNIGAGGPTPLLSQIPNAKWRVEAFVAEKDKMSDAPNVQVLFYVTGIDWNDKDATNKLPCVRLYAVYGTQEVRASCHLQGELGMCLAEIELPSNWFNLTDQANSNTGDEDLITRPLIKSPMFPFDSSLVNLYYTLHPAIKQYTCTTENNYDEGSRTENGEWKNSHRNWITTIKLYSSSSLRAKLEVRLDSNLLIYLPTKAITHGQHINIPLLIMRNSTVKDFVLRVKGKKGMTLQAVESSNPGVWDAAMDDDGGNKHTTIRIQLHKRGSPTDTNSTGTEEIAQLMFEISSVSSLSATRRILWQVDYVDKSVTTGQVYVTTELTVTQKDISAILPIAESPELVNTALLTGRPVTIPLRVVAVEANGQVSDVSQRARCHSGDVDVIKVSPACQYAYVQGNESRGSMRARIQVSYEHLRSSLDLAVWLPRLPLRIQLSDSELSLIRGWNIPLSRHLKGGTQGQTCTPQRQHASVRVLTRFYTESADGTDHVSTLPGADCLADVTHLVRNNLWVLDGRVAELREGTVLKGLEPGSTIIQVLSPVSGGVLGERAVTVSEEKVSVSGLHVTLLSGLSLSLRPSSSEPGVIVASTTAQHGLHSLKQKASLLIWVEFEDNTMVPLSLFSTKDYNLTINNVDRRAASINAENLSWEPIFQAKWDGNEKPIQVVLQNPQPCWDDDAEAVMFSTSVEILVKFGQKREEGEEGGASKTPDAGKNQYVKNVSQISASSTAIGAKTQTEIVKAARNGSRHTAGPRGHGGKESVSDGGAIGPAQHGSNGSSEKKPRGLSDIQIGMYTLLTVFCIAILMFLINCLIYAVKYRRKRVHLGSQEVAHSHEWICLRDSQESAVSTLNKDTDSQLAKQKHKYVGGPQVYLQASEKVSTEAYVMQGECRSGIPRTSPLRKNSIFTTIWVTSNSSKAQAAASPSRSARDESALSYSRDVC
ncbi:unnamed protein product [Lampetra fluviatilis]